MKSVGPAHYSYYGNFLFVSLLPESDATMPATSLTNLQEQIAQREGELQALRQELQSRQSHLSQLAKRKQELLDQLGAIEQEMAALGETSPVPKEQPASATPAAASPSPAAKTEEQPRLSDLILTMLREAKGPMTGRQLHEESIRRGYQPTSQDPVQAMKTRLQKLKARGVVKRGSGQPGFVLAASTNGTHKEPAKPGQPAQASTSKAATKPAQAKPASKKSEGKAPASPESARTAKPGPSEQPPLREVLTRLLEKNRKPQFASQLAAQALAEGYHTNSKNFINTVSASLTNMDNVRHITGQGYLLRRKA